MQAVADGGALLSPGVTRRLIGEFTNGRPNRRPAPTLDVLTEQEREVIAWWPRA